MKLVITVTDDQVTASDEDAGTVVSAKHNGHVEAIDAGPVPESLLGLESEVAAGHASGPGLMR